MGVVQPYASSQLAGTLIGTMRDAEQAAFALEQLDQVALS